MTVRRAVLAGLLLVALVTTGGAPARAATGPTGDPQGWSSRALAAQLLFAGYTMTDTDAALPLVRDGLGGVVLFGAAPRDLPQRLARLQQAATVAPLVASDEEGGQVQRLRALLGPLPSAEQMGRTLTPAQIRARARAYGLGMRRLGVDVDLAPDADLRVPGSFLDREDRTWGATPDRVVRDAGAWQAGLHEAGVVAVAKHWPGHGSAPDSHLGASSTPPLAKLERRDLLPFDVLAKAGIPAVMVGHLTVPGLTEPRTPASLSPAAYRYLRRRVGKGPLLMTDSLSMGAVQRGTGLTPAQAAVRAVESGAEVVLVDPGGGAEAIVAAVAAAIDRGEYPRAAAVAAARHLLAVKRLVRPPAPLVSLQPAAGTTRASLTPTLSALARDPLAQPLGVTFLVRTRGSSRWDVANGARVTVPAGTRATYGIAPGRLLPGSAYEWTARACPLTPPVGAACSPSTPLLGFTTRPAVL